MRKLRYGAIGLAGLVAASVGGVVPVMGQSPAPVTISYLTHWGPDQVAQLQSVADAYHALHPDVTVQIRAVPPLHRGVAPGSFAQELVETFGPAAPSGHEDPLHLSCPQRPGCRPLPPDDETLRCR